MTRHRVDINTRMQGAHRRKRRDKRHGDKRSETIEQIQKNREETRYGTKDQRGEARNER